MSAKMLGQVWDLDLPANKLLVLLALADHADHNGENAYPSADLIAWKTGYSERQVRRILQSLVKDKILSHQPRPGKTSVYSIHLDNGNRKPEYTKKGSQNDIGQNVTPDKMSGVKSDNPGHLDVLPTPDIQMSDEPSFNHKYNTKPAPLLDPFSDAISKVWNTKASGIVSSIKYMMLGNSTEAGWSGSNFDPPTNPAEILEFGKWYKRKNPELSIPHKPEKIQRWFYEFRETAAKKIMPLDDAHDLSKPVEFEPILQKYAKAAGNE